MNFKLNALQSLITSEESALVVSLISLNFCRVDSIVEMVVVNKNYPLYRIKVPGSDDYEYGQLLIMFLRNERPSA